MRDEIDLDYEDRKTGYLTGKAAAIMDWQFRREQKDFTKLVNVLRARKWAKENPEKRREIANRYSRKPEVRARQTAAGTERLRRQRAQARAAGKVQVYRCRECGAEWCPAPWTRGLAGRGEFCTDTCRQRFRYQERTPGARRIRRRL